MIKEWWPSELYASQPEFDNLIGMGLQLQACVSAMNDGIKWECPIDEALRFSRWYYQYHGAGGWLHIVLDDDNMEDDQVEYCIGRAYQEGDIVCKMLAMLIRSMPVEDRGKMIDRLHSS